MNKKNRKQQQVSDVKTLSVLKQWVVDEHLRIEGIKYLLQQDGMEIRSYKSYLRAIQNVAKILKIEVNKK